MKKFNIKGLIVWVLILAAFHFSAGVIISPAAGSFIIGKINEYAGTKISIEKVNVWPLTLSFSLKGIKVFDPDNSSERILKADNVLVAVSPWALLSKRLVFSSVNIKGAEINIEGTADGGFNIQKLAVSKKRALAGINAGNAFGALGSGQDWFSRVYGITKNKFSKQAAAKDKAARQRAKAVTKEVVRLPKGKLVHFRSAKDLYLFEIRNLTLDDAYINLKAQNGQKVEIEKARIRLGRLAFDPDNGARLDLFTIRGQISRAGVLAGSLQLLFSKTFTADTEKVKVRVDLSDVDLDAVRFIYEGSLPVNVVKGKLTLESETDITGDSINSKNSLTLADHTLEPRGDSNLMVGFMPMNTLVEATNSVQPLELKFTITGTLDKPEFGGFQESLMVLAKPIIGNIQEQFKREGINVIGKLFNKKNKGAPPPLAGPGDNTKDQNIKDTVEILNSLLGSKKK